jgi:hypothetical protein
MKPLYKKILEDAKPSFQSRLNDNNKPSKTVANMGLPLGGKSMRSSGGEYTGFTIQVLENVRPLLTSDRVSRAVKQLDEESIQTAGDILGIMSEMQEYGMNVIYNIINIWLKKNDIDILDEYSENELDVELDKKIVSWITTVRNEPIDAKLKIVAIGKSKKGNSVVPENWLDREFGNGRELHKEMDKLDWRKGKAPVHYCCIYSMSIIDGYSWNNINQLDTKLKFDYVFTITYTNRLKLNISKKLINKNKSLKCYPYKYDSHMLLFVTDNNIIEPKPIYTTCDETVGQLISRLQKCVRRGRQCSKTLNDCIYKLYKSKPYNLPDQQYLKVSGCRQLFWRSFISIIEDAQPYEENDEYLSLQEMFALAMLCQADPDIQIKKNIVDMLAYTMLLVQHDDKLNTNWKWRKGSSKLSNSDNYLNLALKYMPMMKNDKNMLIKSYNYLKTFKTDEFELLSKNELLKCSKNKCEEEAILAGYDMHCLPNIIIELQGSLPIDSVGEYSTKEISSMIWEHSSKFNVRNKDKQSDKFDNFKLILKTIQQYKYDGVLKILNINKISKDNLKKTKHVTHEMNDIVKRTAFLLIFGQQVKLFASKDKNGKKQPSIDIAVCGTDEEDICKIKNKNEYVKGKVKECGEKRYFEYMKKENKRMIVLPKPPIGYSWNCKNNKVHTYVTQSANDGVSFYVNNIKMEPFNGEPMLIAHKPIISYELPKILYELVCQTLYIDIDYKYNHYEVNLLLMDLHKQ